jgi:hypothetical protein
MRERLKEFSLSLHPHRGIDPPVPSGQCFYRTGNLPELASGSEQSRTSLRHPMTITATKYVPTP